MPGLLQAMVVDDWKAKLWAQVLPKVKAREDIVLRDRRKRGWAIRKESPEARGRARRTSIKSWAKKPAWCLIACSST